MHSNHRRTLSSNATSGELADVVEKPHETIGGVLLSMHHASRGAKEEGSNFAKQGISRPTFAMGIVVTCNLIIHKEHERK